MYLEAYDQLFKNLWAGEVTTASAWQQALADFIANREAVMAELEALSVKELQKRHRGFYRMRHKADGVKSVWHSLVQTFALEGLTWQPFTETVETAAQRAVSVLTDEQLRAAIVEHNARVQALVKALTRPETLDEFQTFVDQRGEGRLTPEQRVRWDELRAQQTQQERAQAAAQVVSQPAPDLGGVTLALKEILHTKKNAPVWVVRPSARLERALYLALLRQAKALGGYYSAYGPAENHGFLFDRKESAEQFMALKAGEAPAATMAAERRTESRQAAAARLKDLAERLEKKAEADLNKPRPTNTARRAQIADGLEARARADLAQARTIRNLAEAIETGATSYLNGLHTRTQVEALETLLRTALYRHDQAEQVPWSQTRGRAPTARDVEFVQYPYPRVEARDLRRAAELLRDREGYKLVASRLTKIAEQPADDGRITVTEPRAIETLVQACQAPEAGRSALLVLKGALEDYQRVQAAGLLTDPELRAALREYLTYREAKLQADPIRQAMRDLVGVKIEGFVPTPRLVVERLLEHADIREGMTVLEPQAGWGNIADVIRERHPSADLSVIEWNSSLRRILELKGYRVVGQDFLEFSGFFYRIIQNPPFEASADLEHIRHAFDCLQPGGRLVSVMSENAFFRKDTKAQTFRAWLEELGAYVEALPDGAFLKSEVSTGVATRLVVINKPHEISQEMAGPGLEPVASAAAAQAALLPRDEHPRKDERMPPLVPEVVKVGEILANEAGRCVIVSIVPGGFVTVLPLGQTHYLTLAPADLSLFQSTGQIDLKPALLRYLEQWAEARLGDLQSAWGYSRAMGNTPETNPLNRAVIELAEAGQIVVNAEGWGYATNPLIKGAPPAPGNSPATPTLGATDKPLGDVPVEDECRYFGTVLTVVSHGEQLQTWLSKVYNRGRLLEVHSPHCPDDPQATFRVSGEQVVSIDRLVDRQTDPQAPLPQDPAPPTPAKVADPLIAELEVKIAEWGGTDAEISRVIWQVYSGDGARKTRQALVAALTGKKTPMAQCGVSALEQAYRSWKASQISHPGEPGQPLAASPQTARSESETPPPAQTVAANARRTKAEPEGQLSLL